MIRHTVPAQARLDFFNGVHQPTHEYRLALYGPDAALGEGTPGYTADGEVGGLGYDAGGQALTDRVAELMDDGNAFVAFGNPTWPTATISARGAMIYNASVAGQPALAILDFGETVTSTNGPFTVSLPERLITARLEQEEEGA